MVSEPIWEAVNFLNFRGMRGCPRSPYKLLHFAWKFIQTWCARPCCALATAMSWLRHCIAKGHKHYIKNYSQQIHGTIKHFMNSAFEALNQLQACTITSSYATHRSVWICVADLEGHCLETVSYAWFGRISISLFSFSADMRSKIHTNRWRTDTLYHGNTACVVLCTGSYMATLIHIQTSLLGLCHFHAVFQFANMKEKDMEDFITCSDVR